MRHFIVTAKRNSTPSKDFYVYVHRRASDGRVFYVGKGSNNRAWETHKRSQYWKNIVNKHGFTAHIIQSGMQEWWAFEMERELIAYYGREALCNLTDGGDGASGTTISEASRKKISDALSGKKKPWMNGELNPMKKKEARQKLSIALIGRDAFWIKGDKNPSRNKIVREKITASQRGQIRPSVQYGNSVKSKSIICIEENRIFDSSSAAIDWLISIGKTKSRKGRSNICACARLKIKTAYGYTWKFA